MSAIRGFERSPIKISEGVIMETVLGRRQFFEISGKGVLGLAVTRALVVGGAAFVVVGCGFNIAEIGTWVTVGNGAIGSVLNLLVGAGILACVTCSVLANAAEAAITAIGVAVTNWQNAPATDKQTTLEKIQLALQVGLEAATAFFQSFSIPGGSSIISLVLGIAGLVLNAIAGFISQVGLPPAPAAKPMLHEYEVAGNKVQVTPTLMTANQAKSALNKLLVQYGHPELVLH
jgi:hypothetical protein